VVLLIGAVDLRRRGAVLNMATRSPPRFSLLALTRKIRYLRASILNLIHLVTAVHNDRTSDLFNSAQELGGLQPLSS
jgi:hypothetical protein